MPEAGIKQKRLERVLVTVPYAQEKRSEIKNAFQGADVIEVPASDTAAIQAALADVDAALIRGPLKPYYLQTDRIRWVHCDQSGLDRFAKPEIFERGLVVTSSSGRSAETLAEHALFFMLSLTYEASRFAKAQEDRIWGIPGQNKLRGLYGRKVAIVGFGKTGQALARKCLAFGMEVTGYRRKALPSPVEGVQVFSRQAGHTVIEALAGAEFLVMAASLNDGSHHMVDDQALAALRHGAYIVNIGRALTVDQDAMIEALNSGLLTAAGLDVTFPEPLPVISPLWQMENVMITPHVTPQMPDRAQETLNIVAKNAELFLANAPLMNALTPEDCYTKRPANPNTPKQRIIQRGLRFLKRRLAPRRA